MVTEFRRRRDAIVAANPSLKDQLHVLPVFEVAAFRSFASSLWHVLSTSAAEFGYVGPA